MNILFNKKIFFFILVLSAVLLPYSVFASTLYIDTDRSDFFVGDTIQFTVRINSENKEINAVEGEILLDYLTGAASLADLNTAGSPFSLWPDKPLPSENNTSVSFVGGSPGGLISTDAIVLNILLKLQKPGQITLSPNNIEVYLNDGKGTKDNVSINALQINVLPEQSDAPSVDDWNTILSNDKIAPESFDITLGRDPSLFDNQYFISFFTTDAESGMAYYEVQEGKGTFVRAESPYVLTDQSLLNVITVKAVDKAGNERVAKFMPTAPSNMRLLFWIVAILIVVSAITVMLWQSIRRKK